MGHPSYSYQDLSSEIEVGLWILHEVQSWNSLAHWGDPELLSFEGVGRKKQKTSTTGRIEADIDHGERFTGPGGPSCGGAGPAGASKDHRGRSKYGVRYAFWVLIKMFN